MELEQVRIIRDIVIIVLRRLDLRFASGSVSVQHQIKESLHLFLILTQAPPVSAREALCALLRKWVGRGYPRQENTRRLGAFSRNFRPDIAVRKFYKIKPAIGLTGGHPQSPTTRVFLERLECYRFREFAEFPLSICPQTPLYQRFYRYLRGDDINKALLTSLRGMLDMNDERVR